MLSLTLVVFNLASTGMEVAAMCGHKHIVTKLNSYYYSEVIFVILSFILSLAGTLINNGVRRLNNNKLSNFFVLLRRKVVP